MLDQSRRYGTELDVKFIEVLGEEIPLQFMLDGPRHEATQAAIANMRFDSGGESFLNAH